MSPALVRYCILYNFITQFVLKKEFDYKVVPAITFIVLTTKVKKAK